MTKSQTLPTPYLNLNDFDAFESAVIPTMTVQEHSGNDKSCVWHAADFANGNLKEEMFCIRFASVESEHLLFVALVVSYYFILLVFANFITLVYIFCCIYFGTPTVR